ncbi:GNAT family N-acetyltransferase [Ruegeria conchae]|uniref:GNAT family N-acetyltransferase n=1 Tax=Ruegeria conchae TaxID=981384 RepID=UPI0039844778
MLSVSEYATALETVSKISKQEGRQDAERSFTAAYHRSSASPFRYPFRIRTTTSRIAGFCWTTLRKKPRLKTMHLLNLHILPIYRGRGIGSSTMQELEILCRAKNVPIITLSVSSPDPRTRHFYERLGFEGCDNGYIKHL